ncbi:unnamed protein product [Pieris macdunnoughi]|uniref:Secreted protein n=1 Tax=Pieris macdunnoughi TaxID=345717 RepID=A0A821Y010_9NEOP|nr:unnamed protein product [Pieris macdunnoughi]
MRFARGCQFRRWVWTWLLLFVDSLLVCDARSSDVVSCGTLTGGDVMNADLAIFQSRFRNALASKPNWAYTISGVALQTHMGGKQIYSVSLVPPATAGDTPCVPELINSSFSRSRRIFSTKSYIRM